MQQPTTPGVLPPMALHELPDEAMAVVCSFLSTTDLLRLALTSRAGLAIVEDAARRWLGERSEQERGWVPRMRGCLRRWEAGLSEQEGAGGDRECWLELMHEVELLRSPLVFSRAHATIELSQGGVVTTRTEQGDGNIKRPVASDVIMRSGVHCEYIYTTVSSGADDSKEICI